jgi:alpha-beta hydrolase superfamily lysophospholipase
MATELATDHNIGSYLVDLRGHGNSLGPRGDAPTAQQVWQDIDTVLSYVKTKHPNIPIVLAGHSSGAGTILNYSGWTQRKNTVDGYLLLAPYLGHNAGTERSLKAEQSFVKSVRLWALILYGITGGRICAHTPALFFNYPDWIKKQDPHILEYYTCAMSFATSPHEPREIFAHLDKPFALFIGSDDEQFIPSAVTAYAALSKQPSVATVVPEATHLSIVQMAPKLIADAVERLAIK